MSDVDSVAARDPWLRSGHPETQCERCGGPNVWSWSAPSPLWNAVMRNPQGEDAYSIVCPVCFTELASLKGIGGLPKIDGLPRWHWTLTPEGVSNDELTALFTRKPEQGEETV